MGTTVYKQLAAKQDLAIGHGQVVQRRNGKDITVDLIDGDDFPVKATGTVATEIIKDRFARNAVWFDNETAMIAGFEYLAAGFTAKTKGAISAGDGKGDEFYILAGTAVVGDLTLGNGLIARRQTTPNYTVINSASSLIDAEIAQITQSKNVVITGDSLVMNGYAYPAGWGVNAAGYVTDQPYGMSSWSHLLRDLWATGGFFQPIRTSKYYCDCDTDTSSTLGIENIGLNQRAIGFTFAGAGNSLTIINEYTGNASLLISSQPASEAITFDINGVPASSLSTTNDYKGYEYQLVPFTGTEAVITNISGTLIVYGIVSSATRIPKITGKGGWSSVQILAEYGDLVAPYTPDIIFYIIGANDVGSGDPETSGFNASVQEFIDLSRTAVPDCDIFLISMPASSSFTELQILEYVKAGRDLAIANNCSHIDLYEATKNIDPSYWRYDNIHASPKGDTLWFEIFKNLLFPTAVSNLDKFTPVRGAMLGIDIETMNRAPETFSLTVACSVTTPSISGMDARITPYVTAEYTTVGGELACLVTPPTGFKISSIVAFAVSSAETLTARQYLAVGTGLSFRITSLINNTTVNPDNTNIYVSVTVIKNLKKL